MNLVPERGLREFPGYIPKLNYLERTLTVRLTFGPKDGLTASAVGNEEG